MLSLAQQHTLPVQSFWLVVAGLRPASASCRVSPPRAGTSMEVAREPWSPVSPFAARDSRRVGAAYGAVHRARGSYNGFLMKLILACQKLWWNREMALKTNLAIWIVPKFDGSTLFTDQRIPNSLRWNAWFPVLHQNVLQSRVQMLNADFKQLFLFRTNKKEAC
jgi:hypothetical protein